MTRTASGAAMGSFFFNDTATTEIYTLSLHDALPICPDLRHKRFAHLETPWHWLAARPLTNATVRSEEHTSELQSHSDLVCRLLLEKKNVETTVIDSVDRVAFDAFDGDRDADRAAELG